MNARTSLAVILCVVPFVASAGVVIEIEQQSGNSLFTASAKKLRIERKGNEPHVTIFDGDAQRIYEIDPAKREYSEMTQADAQALAKQVDAAMAQLTPEQRARFEAMRKAQEAKGADVKYEPTGKKDTVAGFACQRYSVKRHGEPTGSGCFIPWGAGVKKEDFVALVELGKFMDAYASGAFRGGRSGGARMAEELDRAPGFPAELEHLAGGKTQTRERLVSLKHSAVSDDAFRVPAGYAKVEKGPGAMRRMGRRSPEGKPE